MLLQKLLTKDKKKNLFYYFFMFQIFGILTWRMENLNDCSTTRCQTLTQIKKLQINWVHLKKVYKIKILVNFFFLQQLQKLFLSPKCILQLALWELSFFSFWVCLKIFGHCQVLQCKTLNLIRGQKQKQLQQQPPPPQQQQQLKCRGKKMICQKTKMSLRLILKVRTFFTKGFYQRLLCISLANRCFACCSLVKIIFFRVFTSFSLKIKKKYSKNMQKCFKIY